MNLAKPLPTIKPLRPFQRLAGKASSGFKSKLALIRKKPPESRKGKHKPAPESGNSKQAPRKKGFLRGADPSAKGQLIYVYRLGQVAVLHTVQETDASAISQSEALGLLVSEPVSALSTIPISEQIDKLYDELDSLVALGVTGPVFERVIARLRALQNVEAQQVQDRIDAAKANPKFEDTLDRLEATIARLQGKA